jgi:hypothetical protein
MTLSNRVMCLCWASTVCDLFTPMPKDRDPRHFHFDSSRESSDRWDGGGQHGDGTPSDNALGTLTRRHVVLKQTWHGHIHRAARQPCHQSRKKETASQSYRLVVGWWSASWRLVPSCWQDSTARFVPVYYVKSRRTMESGGTSTGHMEALGIPWLCHPVGYQAGRSWSWPSNLAPAS